MLEWMSPVFSKTLFDQIALSDCMSICLILNTDSDGIEKRGQELTTDNQATRLREIREH
jgi:hypothetical protein